MAKKHRSGLTILEVIVIIVAGAILAAILVPLLARAREEARRVKCQQNLKQLSLAFQMYAKDWNGMYPPKKRVLAPGDAPSDRYDWIPDGLAIYPEYLNDLTMIVCPSDEGAPACDELWEEWLESGGEPNAIRDVIDDYSYVYTGYVAYSGDYGEFVAKAGSQFLGFVRAISELGWEDFDSDITFADEQLEEYKEYTTRHSGTIYRLREGIGKLLVTDATDAAQVAVAESECAVMWDRLASIAPYIVMFNHLGGCNVVFLDGHVEFIKWPGTFPVTTAVATTLGAMPLTELVTPMPSVTEP